MKSTANPRQFGIDASLAAGLLIALSIVYVVDRSSSRAKSEKPDAPKLEIVEKNELETTEIQVEKPLSIAVTRSDRSYDDVGKLLNNLGQGYKYTSIDLGDIDDYSKIAQFDVIFLTCGTHPKSWLGATIGSADRPGVNNSELRKGVAEQVRHSLTEFLKKGGTIYASDWQFLVLNMAFPDDVDQPKLVVGEGKQQVVASVKDDGLREIVGQSLSLYFDMDGWMPAALKAEQMKVLLEGDYRAKDGQLMRAPLLVKYPREKGQIIFTSFHNEKQNSEAEKKLLKFLVFSAVTAKIEKRISSIFANGKFSPSKQSLLSVEGGAQSVSQTYKNKKVGKLLFILGFTAEGADLELTVTPPGGTSVSRRGGSTVLIEIDDAVPGGYRYTITAHKVPYPNFPFTLTIGDK